MKNERPTIIPIVNVNMDIPVRTLVANITRSLNQEELIDLIMSIDLEVAEYDFTEKLKQYFVGEMEKENGYP